MDIDKVVKELENKKAMLLEDMIFLKGHIKILDEDREKKANKLHEISGRIMQIKEDINILKNKPIIGKQK